MPIQLTHSLRIRSKPRAQEGAAALRLVDLFAGCGGLTLGVEQAAIAAGRHIDVALAVDKVVRRRC
jgi:DNA (cytosine-5)-methyltransferase 1